MRRLLSPLVLWFAVATPAAAAEHGGPADCRAIEDAAARLACYDARADAPKPAPAPELGGWVLEEWPSRLNPAWTDYLLWVNALNEVQGSGDVQVRPVLALRCEQGLTDIHFDFGRFMEQAVVPVEYRFGRGGVQQGELYLSADGRRFGLWRNDLALRFVAALASHTQLRIRVNLADDEPIIAAFELDGFAAASRPLAAACGWP